MDSVAPLHVSRTGEGPDLVLLHGWGMHSGIWHDLIGPLQSHFRLHLVDLPGHGQSQQVDGTFDLDRLAGMIWQSVAPQLQGPAVWLGWSLGGMAALQIALDHPEQTRALVLVASTPRFSQAADWPHAMSMSLLDTFAEQLAEDYQPTLQRFLALQVKGSDDARATLRTLRQRVLDNAGVNVSALQSGLAILKQADLRHRLHEIRHLPLLMIFGEYDMLVPPSTAKALAEYFDDSLQVVIDGAGHAPFVSQPQQFIQHVMTCLHATK
ncbi:pimeloyl-ACP methyl ester esterase BioH [Thiohalophilus thiocyanatoxydans]|uniref:Pimeloyl-[acyl-carrier protein] methyl ester esterase n=1 Tax=Thiohalophilus thiocyanatoxydans TaxID=381308 RepID=A0A4R8ISQ8_9GAMM|nr:pimeloyl-ACP methyl ester esterase BioH [Thiohalophilus thiocyanatoxydans]TDY04082.1 carboxylesterase BioH (pimeloyl-CoA synthesis) [Thiohalophilus thiocyanatoxydans]